ncbi:MAG: phosphatidate cytidylyltransferase, partial [Bacteroidales bacterium]|nr:phosphatidate cytidylyltransferase [Bacteroidales bacterium]
MAVIALITVTFGIFGDLFESLIKRRFGVKDSGRILLGHGGILDRFDGAIFVFPAVTAYLMLVGVL